MFRKSWLLLLGIGLMLAACRLHDSNSSTTTSTNFFALLKRLNWPERGDTLLPPPLLYRDSAYTDQGEKRQLQFELWLADKPLGLQSRVVQLRGHGYPVSYSVLFQNCLVALFKNGKFGCYRLTDFTPDEQLARQLNTGNWQRHWLIGGQLVAQNKRGYYAYDPRVPGWQPYEQPVPFGKQPKLYEDARYLVYASCKGEFGGTAYFYNKQTGQTHYVGATCANSIWQEDGHYKLLASLGHMMGSAGASTIITPELLPLTSVAKKALATDSARAIGRKNILLLFDFYGIQLFGALRYQNQTLYLMYWHDTTFLATIDGKRITIVDPLFTNSLYTHDPVTTSYGPELTLTNLDFYSLGGSDEVAALLWQRQQVTKVEWGEQPDEQR